MTRHRMLALAVALTCSSAVSMSPATARTNLSTNTDANSGEALLAVVQQDLHRVDLVSAQRNGLPVVRRLGRRGRGQGELILPGGAAVGPGGVVWVSDSGNNRLQRFDRNGEVDLVVRDLAGHGALSQPGALAFDPERGHLFVTDTDHDRVVVLDGDGRALATWGVPGQAAGSLLRPHGIALSPDGATVYVIDLVSPRVQAFTPGGGFVRATGTGPGAPSIVNPTAISTGPDGDVYLTDETLGRVSRLSPDLEILDTWGGSHGSGPGAFYNPQGVAVDARGRVWVVDYGNHRGQVFTTTGEFLSTFLDGQVGMLEAKEVHTSAGRLPPYAVLVGGAVMILVEIARRTRGRRTVLEPL
ncbi:MAG: NHL repeat-containing protein [Acidimicrobiia bacterium]